METLHTIDYNDIKTSIGSPKQAVDLIRDLIWAKGGRQRIDLTKISGLKFKEKGIISKKGVIEIYGPIKLTIEGKLDDARYLHQTLVEKIE